MAPTVRAPSAASHTNKIDLKLGYACERQCHFCVQGDLRRRFPKPKSAAELTAALREGRSRAEYVVFTGGEPTHYPWLPELVRCARLLGYTRIQVQTNGRRLADAAYCRQLVAAGANEFAPSVHGSTAELHDFLTDAPGSFARTWAGIETLVGLGQTVMTNTVVTTRNYADLPALAERLAAVGVRHIQFAFVHIVGQAAKNAAWLVPKKSDAVPWMLKAVDAGRAGGARCFTEGVPLCLLRGYEDCAAERVMPVMTIYHADGTTCEDFTRERVEVQKRKGPDCAACAFDAACEGPWHEYPELYGFSEFVPVRP